MNSLLSNPEYPDRVRGWGLDMIRTIELGNYISVQGFFERLADNGNIVVRVGAKTFEGKPVGK